MVDTVRYWDGSAWTGQVAPAPTDLPAIDPSAVVCAYCGESMKAGASRCPHCGGPYFWCKHDKANMPVSTKSKWVGTARGGREDSHRCMKCGRIIAGAKW